MEPTEDFVLPTVQLMAAMTNALGVGGILHNPDLHLYTNNYVPSRADTLGSYTEATFPGYVKKAIVPLTPYVDSDGSALVMLGNWSFVAGVVLTPQTVYGWYLTDSTDAVLYGAAKFANPVPVNAQYDAVDVVPFFRINGTQDFPTTP